jgi:hypothetical protein
MASEPPVNVGNVAGYIRDMIGQGLTATDALAAFRRDEGAIRDSRWYALYGQITDTVARYPEFLAINPYVLPDSSQYGTWAMGSGNKYATTVEMQLIDRGTGLLTTQLRSYVTDVPHTGIEAEANIAQDFVDNNAEQDYGVTLLGTNATAYYQTVPYGSQ